VVARRAKSVRPGRRAFTLLELLLTLCLLVVLAALTWPALGRPMANQRLRSAADEVRTQWARARVAAISSGRVYAFRYAPNSDRYAVRPLDTSEFCMEGQGTEGTTPVEAEAGGAVVVTSREQRLPEGVLFTAGEKLPEASAASSAAPSVPASQEGLTSEEGLAWAEPILFHPDGTTSTAQLRLVNEHGATVDVSLRGLTGLSTVGPVTRSQEAIR
jgi:prepilin-type N-terminal cleavage/methylation domain-containing protein